ncbi:MAG TPA: 5-oxoprolinase subunit PxpB [Vicinamibacterales bacterium]|jgi:inhibitor of KinA
MSDFVLRPAGDAAIVVDFEPRLDPLVNARAVGLALSIRETAPAGVRDVVVGYHSVTTYYDPLAVEADDLLTWLGLEARRSRPAGSTGERTVTVPVLYGGEAGPDLGGVAEFAGCDEREVIRLHSSRTYRVYMLGFMPGFAYMAEVDPRIAAPRRQAPRVVVPAGSIGIAGPQTGVYPVSTPGGWNLIGRTPLVTFDPLREEPCVFRAGDAVRFAPIDAWPA